MGQTLEHRIGYVEKLSRKLLQGYTPHFRWVLPHYWGTADGNVLRVAEICDKLDQIVKNEKFTFVEDTYIQALVTAVANGDTMLEQEVLKSLGDHYLTEGKKLYDVSQLSKAAAMYNKALTKCTQSEGKQTLFHRVRYTEKAKDVINKHLSRKGQKEENQVKIANSTPEDVTSTQSDNIHDYHPVDFQRQYQGHLNKGSSSLQKADLDSLDSAEQHFAEALKLVHVRDPTDQQYQREVEPLNMLGDVYTMRGQQTGDGGDFVKAAALYHAAIARSSVNDLNHGIENAIRVANELFLKHVLGLDHNVQKVEEGKHNKQLKEMRARIKIEMETIDQQLDPNYLHHDEDNQCMKEKEAKRSLAVRHLFERIASERKQFVSQLVEECILLMGPPPCKYALIGLGSQATELVTPYSDLEFAILVEDEGEECLRYFRTLTHFLHLKVVNLGETILPALGIRSLNDFYSEDPLDNWFYDSVTPRGVAFDGSMPRASKTPLGRQATTNKPPSELIRSPSNMVHLLQTDATVYMKEGYHLASILRNPCLIVGDLDLVNGYREIVCNVLTKDVGKLALMEAQDTLRENMGKYNKQEFTAKLIDVKKEIYRLPSLAVDCCALCSQVIPTSVWNTIDEMESKRIISADNAHHLRVLVSISAELRLRTYIANGGQNENLSALASLETPQEKDDTLSRLQTVFYISKSAQLFRYYYTAVPLKKALAKLQELTNRDNSQNVLQQLFTAVLFDDSPKVKGIMYMQLQDPKTAINNFEKALEMTSNMAHPANREQSEILAHLGMAYGDLGEYKKAASLHEEGLQKCRTAHGLTTAHLDIVIGLNNLGISLGELGKHKEALSYHEQALQLLKNMYGPNLPNYDIVVFSLEDIAGTWQSLGDYKKAISFYEQALKMVRTSNDHSTTDPIIAGLLSNLGSSCDYMGDHQKAISCHEEALQMRRAIYGKSTAHSDIATSLNNLGGAWGHLGDYDKAISYHEQALQIIRMIYGPVNDHPLIASALNNLGIAWQNLGDYSKAISYKEEVLQMRKVVYGQTKAHPHVAESLSSLGTVWYDIGDYKKAIRYHEQALEMELAIYGQGAAHPSIAGSLSNLESTWSRLGEYSKAIIYGKQALDMRRAVFGQDTAHPDIASSLNNLGILYNELGDHRKALMFCEESLQMRRKIYGMTENVDIAASLMNIAYTWSSLEYHKKAISHIEEALQIYRTVFGPSTVHSFIATCLNNIGEAWRGLGDHRKAILYCEEALRTFRTIHGHSIPHHDIASTLTNVGLLVWYDQGDLSKAMSYLLEALQMFRSIYGQSTPHRGTANALNNLGVVWNDQGDHRKAISYHEEALQNYRAIYGEKTDHSQIIGSLKSLGAAWNNQGDYRKAVSYYEEALQMYRGNGQRTQKCHLDIADALNDMGSIWCNWEDYKKAISYHNEALQMYRHIYGQSTAHADIATSLKFLGSDWHYHGDYKKAISYLDEALQMYRSIYGPSAEHSNIADSLQRLGLAWEGQGYHQKCISYHEEALQMYRKIYGNQSPAHPDIASSLNNLGSAWNRAGEHRKAISYQEEALLMFISVYGQSTAHSDIAKTLHDLGRALHDQGDHGKAIGYYEQALQMLKSVNGQIAHPHIANLLHELGSVWHDQGDHEKAIGYYEQALQMFRSAHGQSKAHPDIAKTLSNLGLAWDSLGDSRQAITFQEEALQMHRSIYDQTTAHPEIATILSNLGSAWSNLGDHKKSSTCYEESLKIYRAIYGQSTPHPDIATMLSTLGTVCRQMHAYEKALNYSEDALQMWRDIFGQTAVHDQIARSLYDVGAAWFYLKLHVDKDKDYTKAICYFEEEISMRKTICSHDATDPDIADTLAILGAACLFHDDVVKAYDIYRQALVMMRQIYQDESHPKVQNVKSNMAEIMKIIKNMSKK
uniref:Protein-PII uridylyltransferase N-terminal domain-containing protein n=1 Tax=Branchiostoma floridae TaxID=7739 RepID=C3Z2D2_BRAFL|eukprot:XP_002597171.1 hypothetical protein BRAFLDRAFT_66299 [Branchiostoma floridae]